jgi:hypothetical protein
MSAQLQADHRAALDDLVEAGELDAVEAEHVQAIFGEALDHIQSSLGTCYEAIPIYVPDARGQLLQQADLLAEMAEKQDVDHQAVAQAQAALERDMAFLNLSEPARMALYAKAGTDAAYPPFDELDLDITPSTAKATRFLVEVLLQE